MSSILPQNMLVSGYLFKISLTMETLSATVIETYTFILWTQLAHKAFPKAILSQFQQPSMSRDMAITKDTAPQNSDKIMSIFHANNDDDNTFPKQCHNLSSYPHRQI